MSDASRESPTPPPSAAASEDSFRRLHLWQIQGIRDLILAAVVLAVVYLGYALSSVTVPLLLGLLFAYLFEPLVQWLSRFRWCPRPVAAVGIITLAGGTLLLALALAIPLAVGQAVSLIETLRSGKVEARVAELIEVIPEQYRDDAQRGATWIFGHPVGTPIDDAAAQLEQAASEDAAAQAAEQAERSAERDDRSETVPATAGAGSTDASAPETPQTAEAGGSTTLAFASDPGARRAGVSLLGLAGSGLRTLYELVVGTLALLLAVVLIPFYFYYFSVSYPRTLEFVGGLVPEENRTTVFALARKMDSAVAGFVRGRIVISAIMGSMLAVGWLSVGVPYAILLGLVTGVLCAVPYLGGVGVPLAVGLLALDNVGVVESERMAWWAVILWPTLVFAVVQLVEGYILTPVIAGKATDLSPLAIFVAVLAGGALAGVYGMLLSIPVAACVKIVLVDVLLPRIRAWTRGETSDPLPMGMDD
jgi:predicted PurR-regulated permease PerM